MGNKSSMFVTVLRSASETKCGGRWQWHWWYHPCRPMLMFCLCFWQRKFWKHKQAIPNSQHVWQTTIKITGQSTWKAPWTIPKSLWTDFYTRDNISAKLAIILPGYIAWFPENSKINYHCIPWEKSELHLYQLEGKISSHRYCKLNIYLLGHRLMFSKI